MTVCHRVGMPPIWAEEDAEGRLRILDGVTRAVRMAKYLPGQIVVVKVTEHRKYKFNTTKCVADVVLDENMKTEATQELLETLSKILTYAPNLRLGQLLGILADRADVPYTAPNLIVEVEDDELLQPAKEFLEVMRKRHEEIVREERAVA